MNAKRCASISGLDVKSDCDFIIYGHTKGLISECVDLQRAQEVLTQKRDEAKAWNAAADLAVFRWSDGHWIPAISLYDLQESDLVKNPSVATDFL